MTPTIQLLMLAIAATIMLSCNVKSSDVASGSVFKSGMVAIVSVFGVAWMADTYFGAYIPAMKKTLSAVVLSYPWLYAAVLFLVSKLINSQAAAVAVIVPMALSVGVDPLIIVSFMASLEHAFDFKFKSAKGLDGASRYIALESGDVDIIDAFTTDGLLKKFDLVVLKDDKNFFPPYFAVPLVRSDVLKKHPEIVKPIEELGALLDDETMLLRT